MAAAYKDKPNPEVLVFNGKWVSYAHTACGYGAFIAALIIGMSLHFHKIVQNAHYGYPDEWFPSVSATIGDRYPERSVFQILAALASGPRFVLIALWYLVARQSGDWRPEFVAIMGVLRTVTCGGWVYITSTDDHDVHDVFMISYMILTIPWTIGCISLGRSTMRATKWRKIWAVSFFSAIIPLIYFYIQHRVHRIAGAYTTYAFFEWSLIVLDVLFDSVTALDFDSLEVVVRDVKGTTSLGSTSDAKSEIAEPIKPYKPWIFETYKLSLNRSIDLGADIYHGYVFWSMLTGLGILIWYFPLWYMGISGYEAFVMAPISPLLLGISPLRTLIKNNLRLVHLLSLAGVAAYLVPDPKQRLFTAAFGVSMSCLAWAATFASDAAYDVRLERRVLALLMGLILSSLAKFAWWTNNPIWAIMHSENGGLNHVGLAAAIVAAIVFTNRVAPAGNDVGKKATTGGSSILSALGFGGLMFGLHSLLSDTSTMILWVWEGYPVRGPQAVPDGWMTIVAMTFGLGCGTIAPKIATSGASFGIACAAAATLIKASGWPGYAGALITACYLMSLSVPLLTEAAKSRWLAVTFGLGYLVYNFLVLFHVWVVAYAFVPGGPLVREHTDWIMMTMMALLAAGVYNLSLRPQPVIPSIGAAHKSKSESRRVRQWTRFGAYALLINGLFFASTHNRMPKTKPEPYHSKEKLITAGIWTIHFSLDNDMWSSEYRMRDLLKELEVDVVGLLESDLQRIIMGNRDTTQFLAENLGMYVDYGPGPNKHTWGAALLSKFPIVNSTHHLLPSPVGELAPAIHATIDAYGTLVDVFVFHSGQEEDEEDRRLQSQYLAKLMGSTDRPSFLLSYLVTRPFEGNYNTYVSNISKMRDVEPADWDRWCEYILYKNMLRVGYARVSRDTITDTELQLAKFIVPTTDAERTSLAEKDVLNSVRELQASEVPEGLRWPAMFEGNGVRGHRYHVFNKPRYYGLAPASAH